MVVVRITAWTAGDHEWLRRVSRRISGAGGPVPMLARAKRS